MPSDPLKSNGWSGNGSGDPGDVSDQQLSHYYNAAASQYNQHYNLYSSPYYRFPYLPTAAANASAIYGHGYSATGFDYNGYPAAAYGVQYYNKASNSSTSPISTFQQYTNNLVNANNFNAVAAAAAINQQSGQSTANYYSNSNTTSQKQVEPKPKKTKRKKQATSNGKQEVVYKRVYIWELDDLCGDEFNHQLMYNPQLPYSQSMKELLSKIMTVCFQLNSPDDFDHTNIEDATVDENLTDPSQQLFANQSGSSVISPTDNEFGGQMKTENLLSNGEKQDPQLSQSTIPDSLSLNPAVDNIKRMAASQQRIRSVYTHHQQDIMGLIKSYALESELPLCRMADTLRRLDASRPYAQCLKLIHDRSVQATATGQPQQANIVISRDPLSFTLAKLLVHGSAAAIDIQNVYSASRSEISTAIERVIARFKREKLVLISSKAESIQLGRSLNIPVWPITQMKDVENFYVALDRILS